MMLFFKRSRVLGCLLGLCVVSSLMFCTKKATPTAPDTRTATKIPKLVIVSPQADTLVARTLDSVTIAGIIADTSDVIDFLIINGADRSTALNISVLTTKTFSAKVKLAIGDTTKIIVKAKNADSTLTTADTVTIYRTPAVAHVGKAKISGVLYKEGAAGAPKLLRPVLGKNAAGMEKFVSSIAPVSGADVMFYNANSFSTASDTSVKTNADGSWNCELPPGNYFVFTVYLDRENMQIITAALPNVEAVVNRETATGPVTAIADDVKPMVLTIGDAVSADADGQFIVGAQAQGMPVIITFSESMTRSTCGDSTSVIVLGPVNPTAEGLALTDTVPVIKEWSADGKELRLQLSGMLDTMKTYKVVIPVSVKDLALNKIDKTYSGILKVVSKASLPPFGITMMVPLNNDTIPLGYPVEVVFSRQVDALSLADNWVLTSSDTAIKQIDGYCEVHGSSAKFVMTTEWKQGATYTFTIKKGVKDLLGDSLSAASAVTFTIKPADAFQQQGGTMAGLAIWIEQTMSAYLAGDIATFSMAFHPQFQAIEFQQTATGGMDTIGMSREVFLDRRRQDIEQNYEMERLGVITPVWYYISTGTNSYLNCIKLTKGTTSLYMQDLSSGGYGIIPKVFRTDSVDVSDSVRFFDRGIVYHGDSLVVQPDMSSSFVDANTRNNDPRYYGLLLREQTNVETQDVYMQNVQDVAIKSIVFTNAQQTEANLVEEISQEIRYLDNKFPFPNPPSNPTPQVMKNIMVAQMKVVAVGDGWQIMQLASKNVYSGDATKFTADSVSAHDFAYAEYKGTAAIDLIAPTQGAVKVAVPVVLKWTKNVDAGGYLVAISDEMRGGNKGLLVFTRDTSITIHANATVTGGTILNIDPQSLPVPLPRFAMRLDTLNAADSLIYEWKVAAISDTVASKVDGTGMNLIADSDFGKSNGLGIFTLVTTMPDISTIGTVPPTGATVTDMFIDSDKDGFPDWVELAFVTNPYYSGSYPNYTLDTDLDGYPDFMEEYAGTNPALKTSKPADANANGIPDSYESRTEWNTMLRVDDDNDGYPNEIEYIYGTGPYDATSRPTRMVKPSLPVGTYYSVVAIQSPDGNQNKTFTFTVASDTSVTIDTAAFSELTRFGYPLPHKLGFVNGEWTFYAAIAYGPTMGSYYKVRFNAQPPSIYGMVDIVDSINGVGNYIGSFWGTTDSAVNVGSLPPPPLDLNPGTGPVVLGPAPAGMLDSSGKAGTLSMTMVVDSITMQANVTLVFDGRDTVFADNQYWAPGQWPALRFSTADPTLFKNWHVSFDGNLNMNGNSLIMSGPLYTDSLGNSTSFRYTLINSRYNSINAPRGVWNGWYSVDSAMILPPPVDSNNAQPYFGDESGIITADRATGGKALVMYGSYLDTLIKLSVRGWSQTNGGPWTAIAVNTSSDTTEFFFAEKTPGDMAAVKTATIGGIEYLVLIQAGPKPGTKPAPFAGDSATVYNALSADNGNAVAMYEGDPMPHAVLVSVTSLRRLHIDTSAVIHGWIFTDFFNDSISYIVLNDPVDPSQIGRDAQGKVMLGIIGGGSTPPPPTGTDIIPYFGATAAAQSAINATGGAVIVVMYGNSLRDSTVINTGTVGTDPNGMVVVHGATFGYKIYAFLQDRLGALRIENGKAVVVEITKPDTTYPGGGKEIKTYTNAAVINAELATSSNMVIRYDVMARSLTTDRVAIDPVTMRDSTATDGTLMIVANSVVNSHRLVFVASQEDSNLIWLEGIYPVVVDLDLLDNGSGTPPNGIPPSDGAFIGSLSVVESALRVSAERIIGLSYDSLTQMTSVETLFVDLTSLTTVSGDSSGRTSIVVGQLGNASRTFVFLGKKGALDSLLVSADGIPCAWEQSVNQGGGTITIYSGAAAKISKNLADMDTTTVREALMTTGYEVFIIQDSTQSPVDHPASVDKATLMLFQSPTDPNAKGIIAQDLTNPAIWYVFVGVDNQPETLRLEMGAPVAFIVPADIMGNPNP